MKEQYLKITDGDILEFKACYWDDGWNFSAPLIIYSPIFRYFETGSLCKEALESPVEKICIDLCLGDNLRTNFSEWELHDFKWRGWSPKGFSKRKSATHHSLKVKFYLDNKGKMTFDFLQ